MNHRNLKNNKLLFNRYKLSPRSYIINLSNMGILGKKPADVPRRRRLNLDNETATPLSRADNSFRRGRTIVGTIVSEVSTSDTNGRRGHGLNVDSPRTHVHHLSIKRRKLSGLLVISVLMITVLGLLITNFTASVIVNTSDKLTKPINEKIYQQAIDGYLNANPLNRFSFLLDSVALSDYVSSKLPEVVNVRRQGNSAKPGETDYVISFRNPVAGWQITGKQYYVDAKGVSFERNYYVDPAVQIVDNSGISPQAGVAIASKRFLGFVGQVVSLSNNSGHQIVRAVLPKNTTRELDVYFKDLSLYAKLSVDRPVGEQIEDMSRAIGYFVTRNQMPQYIDVRVSGKAFYKY